MKTARKAAAVIVVLGMSTTAILGGSFKQKFREFLFGSDRSRDGATLAPDELDSATRACLACHNGEMASHITVKSGEAPLTVVGSGTADHPLGMDYDAHAARDPRGLRPRSALDPRIRLIEGKVGCLSCHAVEDRLDLASILEPTRVVASAGLLAAPQPDPDCPASDELATEEPCIACHRK